jgi:putative DNA primase/helicase
VREHTDFPPNPQAIVAAAAATEDGDGCVACVELEALLQTRRSLCAAAPQDPRVEEARAVRIEDEAARRGIKLHGGNERSGPCPVCGGTDRFSINVKKQLWNCRHCGKGGDVIALVRHLDARPAQPSAKRIVVARFDYHDAHGAVVYQVERVEYQNPDGSYVPGKDGKRKKDFPQRRPDPARPGEWIYNLGDTRRVLYRLPELNEALAYGRTVVLVEGEAKADLLWRWNIPATCSPMGAKNWRGDLYAATLRGANILVLPDNDPDGRLYLDAAAVSLKEVGATVRVLELPGVGPKGDIIDWERGGGTVEQLHALIEHEVRPWVPSERESMNAGPALALAAPEIITRRANEIALKPIAWLWKYWLARGKLHIIAGVPETGKTTIALYFAAVLSSGGEWPDGTIATAGDVLIWTSEDDPEDTLIPRLTRMGADLSRIHFIEQARPPDGKPRPFNPATDLPALEDKTKAIGNVALLILDPVVAAVPMSRNSHNNSEARHGMQPVVDYARSTGAAAVGIGHLTKGTAGKDPLERVNGSVAFGALPRLVMGAAKNEADAGEGKPDRIMVRVKSNIGPSGGGFGYHIDMAPLLEQPDIEATRIVWEHALEGTARELLNDAEGLDEDAKTSKIAEAMVFLKTALADGERLGREVAAEAKKVGISERTLERAMKGTVGKRKAALGWYWWSLR